MEVKTNEIVDKYIKLRDKKAKMKADFDASVAEIDSLLDQMEAVIMQELDSQGATSIKTASGTAYIQSRVSASVADWDAYFFGFVVPNQAWEFLERRVSKTAVEQYKAANEDVPPGVNYSETRTVNVRRS